MFAYSYIVDFIMRETVDDETHIIVYFYRSYMSGGDHLGTFNHNLIKSSSAEGVCSVVMEMAQFFTMASYILVLHDN